MFNKTGKRSPRYTSRKETKYTKRMTVNDSYFSRMFERELIRAKFYNTNFLMIHFFHSKHIMSEHIQIMKINQLLNPSLISMTEKWIN